MIKTLEITSFKSLAAVEVELGQVNVLVGANGVGKSNLLEAIGVLGAAADGRVEDASLLRRGVRPGLPSVYTSSFRDLRLAPQIALRAASADAEYRVSLRNPIEHPEAAWTYFAESLSEVGERVFSRGERSADRGDPTRGQAALTLASNPRDSVSAQLMSDLQRYRIYTPDTHTLRGLVVDPQQEDPVGLSGGRLAEAVQSTLAALGADRCEEVTEQALELLGWVEGFRVRPAAEVPMSRSVPTTPFVIEFRDKYMRPGRQVVSGYDASEGAVLVLFLMVLALHPRAPRIAAVDNFDHGLNPRLARAVAKTLVDWLLTSGDRQVLLTAHNPLVLDGLPLQDDRVRLFTVDRTDTGRTALQRITVTDEMRARHAEGWSLSRMWVAGMLGGVPDV